MGPGGDEDVVFYDECWKQNIILNGLFILLTGSCLYVS